MKVMTQLINVGERPSQGLVPRGRPPLDMDRDRWDALVAVGRAARERNQADAKLAAAEQVVQDAVDAARAQKASWVEIADELGLSSRQAAQRKYGRG